MANEWLSDARKIPDEVMRYIRKLAVRAVVEFGWSPECVYEVFGISRSSLYGLVGGVGRKPGRRPLPITLPADKRVRELVVCPHKLEDCDQLQAHQEDDNEHHDDR